MSNSNASEIVAVVPTGSRLQPWHDSTWQRLWLASQADARPWRSLALVPAGPGVSPATMVQIAYSLAHTGMMHLGTPVHVADATRITLAQLVGFTEELEQAKQSGMVLIALSALEENVTSLSLARSTDYALLCVVLRQMAAADGKQTVERIGKDRFLGSAVFRAGK